MSESDIYELLGAFTALGAGALSLGMIIAAVVIPVILLLVFHYVEAIPVFKIAKKMGVDKAWIALIPIKLCSTYVLSCIPGEREIDFFGKFKCKNVTAFLIYLGVLIVGLPVLSTIGGAIGGILGLIPFIGPILASLIGLVLGLIPAAVFVIIDFMFLRDVLDLYFVDKKSSKTTALVVTIINHVTYIARGIYLWTLLKKDTVKNNVQAEYSEI